METEKVKVTFYPESRQVEIPQKETLLYAAMAAGIPINAVCSGEGICGKCKMIVREGKVTMEPTTLLTREEIQHSVVLACMTRVETDCIVEVPSSTRLSEVQAVIAKAPPEKLHDQEKLEKKVSYLLSPLCEKIFLDLPLPSLSDSLSDLSRIKREIRKIYDTTEINISLFNTRKIPDLLRDSDWKITVTVGHRKGGLEILGLEKGDRSRHNYGVAIDVGTTTIVVSLLDLVNDRVLGTKGTYNPQSFYGADVITRIIYADKNRGLAILHGAVVGSISKLISSLCSENGISAGDITCAVEAGNTTMTHLLLKLVPKYIRKEPYIPAVSDIPVFRASEVGIFINPGGLLYCIPGVASYVGGDITSGIIASGLADSNKLSFLMDIGTNGEVVLGCSDWQMCCSCSAGPAFEGGGIKYGMRASRGAIQEVEIEDNEINYRVIGDVAPRGICGSGLIDLIAEMMRNNLIDRAGKFTKKAGKRLRQTDEVREFIIVFGDETETGEDIVISEIDIENLLRAKAAMYVGARFMLQKAGMSFSDLSNFYLAGSFGNYINLKNAVTIGLLPDINMDKFHFIGNSSITGAKLCLRSRQALQRAHDIAHMMTNFELSVEPAFMNEFTSALFLPHTESEYFPNVLEELGWK
ncbi:MAG: DUF4445 domain-containing protein [Candidatus Eremiobacteraeota bacterium]|nr:DUF4445 domain-containing protein [Candidatus Eremiobacteraeota bacterium]